MKRALVALMVVALGPAAHAQGDDGDAPDVEAPRPAGALARAAVIVLGADGEPLAAATRATLQVSMERALERDDRLEVVDQDVELARRGGVVPVETVSEARGLLRAGEELLRRGQTAQALAKLEAASAHLADVLAWTRKQELAQAQFLLGAAHAVHGDKRAALARFVALLAWRPDFVADPTLQPGEVMPVWEKAQARVEKLPGGSIEISSTPEGAMAYVDGRFVGFTPTVVEALPAATHYVTVKLHGRIRAVKPVKVSDRRPASLRVELVATPEVDRVRAAIDQIAPAIGKEQMPAKAQAALGDLAELLEIDHAVVLVVPDDGMGEYRGYVYRVEGGVQLARDRVTLGERDPAEAFGELARELYAGISFEPLPPPDETVTSIARPGRPFYKRWWFWSGVGAAVAAGVAIPLIVGRDSEPPLACPPTQSCGTVIFRF